MMRQEPRKPAMRHEPPKPPDNSHEREAADTSEGDLNGAETLLPKSAVGVGNDDDQVVGINDHPYDTAESRCDEERSDDVADGRGFLEDVPTVIVTAEKPEELSEPSSFGANDDLSTTLEPSDDTVWPKEYGPAFPEEGKV